MKQLMIIDGNSIINRAYYGIRPLSTKEGIPTNGIFGFMNILLKHTEALKPDYIAVAFDLKAPTFRHKEYSLYKARRTGMPDDLALQIPHLKSVLSAMKIKMLSLEGYEADDIIGTVSRMCERENVRCAIVTGDRDDLQLASPLTTIYLTLSKAGQTVTEEIDENAFIEKYHITPKEFIDVKGLMGDSSDNIPGISGIGEKTAFMLIEKFHSIEGVYENLDDEIVKPAMKKKLEAGLNDAIMSRKLATIVTDAPIDFALSDALVQKYDEKELSKELHRLELKKIADRLGLSEESSEDDAPETSAILPADESVLKAARGEREFYFYPLDGEIFFASNGLSYKAPASALSDVLSDKNIKKFVPDYKKTRHILSASGIELNGEYYDYELAAYVLNPSGEKYDLETLCASYSLPAAPSSLPALFDAQTGEIRKNGQERLLYDIELPLANVLYEMERVGFAVNKDELAAFGKTLGERLSEIEELIYFMAGKKFNINSPKQLGQVLFEDLGLPVVKNSKRGYSTDSEVLSRLSGKHDIIDLISEYRALGKLKSTYTDSFLPLIDENSRIHSTLKQTVTATGRISSAEPNLQNIPTRTPLGREMRKMFVARDNCELVGADYSQIELRVLAHISKDTAMTQAFQNGEDIHTLTASRVFNVPPFLVTDEMRSAAKTVNFGIIYGQGDFSLAKELKITIKEAKSYIQSYFEKYSGVKEYMDKTIASARELGYVTTIFGRRRYIKELFERNKNVVAFGERVAMNTPIQGSAADIIKIAMIRVYEALKEKAPSSKLVMQVHDELIVEAVPEEVETVKTILKEEMENAAKLDVPLIAQVKSGKRWYDTK